MKKGITFTDENIQDLFGYEDAESEPIERLMKFYFKNEIYSRVTSDLPIRVLVGHKGIGKSALFKVSIAEEKEKHNLPILIKPDDIAEIGKSNENFLLRIRQWKVALTKIIGLKAFEELGFSNEEYKGKLAQFGLKLVSFLYDTVKTASDMVDMTPTQQLAIKRFLDMKRIIVYIDDLDRGWEGKKDDIHRISALLNCIRDMANDNPGLLFKVSLRSDVYYLVRTSDESTDKIEGSVVWFRWSNHEIFVMLIKRVMTYFNYDFNEETLLSSKQKDLQLYLETIMEPRFTGRGKWNNADMYRILMSLNRKRPRDLVKLCSLAAREAYAQRSNLITTAHFESIFEEYSQGRIQDTINEYRSELPNISNLIFGMKPTKKAKKTKDSFVFTTPSLYQKLDNIMQQNRFIFANGDVADKKQLAQFLFKINFLTARKEIDGEGITRKYFEENRYLSNSFTDFGFDWEIHPAFRWALQPDNSIEVSAGMSVYSNDMDESLLA